MIAQGCLYTPGFCGYKTEVQTFCCCDGPNCNDINFVKQCLQKASSPITTTPRLISPSVNSKFSCHHNLENLTVTQECSGNYIFAV